MFSKKLKELRIEKGITQDDLAQVIYVSRSAIAKWEQGRGMPSKQSLALLAKYFEVSESELLKEDDPVIIIDNIEKSSYKVKLTLALSFTYAISLLLIILLFVLSSTKIFVHDGKFFTNSYLKDFGLNSLQMIEGDDYFTVGEEDFFSNISNQNTFYEYASYVYGCLKNSPHISYLSHAVKVFTRDYDIEPSKYYLVQSDDLNDHISKYANVSLYEQVVSEYEFYFITKSASDRKEKDEVQANCLIITSYAWDSRKRVNYDKEYNFNIKLFTRDFDYEGYDVFLSNEYFNVQEISINKENISEYFHIVTEGAYGEAKFSIQNLDDTKKQSVIIKFVVNLLKRSEDDGLIITDSKEFNVYWINDYYSLNLTSTLFGFEDTNFEGNYEIEFEWQILEDSKLYLMNKK